MSGSRFVAATNAKYGSKAVPEACRGLRRSRGLRRGVGATTDNGRVAGKSRKLDTELNLNIDRRVGVLQEALALLGFRLKRAVLNEYRAVLDTTTVIGASIKCFLKEVYIPARHEVGMIAETLLGLASGLHYSFLAQSTYQLDHRWREQTRHPFPRIALM